MKRSILFLTLLGMCVSIFAQDNFKLSGTLSGVTSDTIHIEYTGPKPENKDYEFNLPVVDGKFSFSTNLPEECFAKIYLLSTPRQLHYLELLPDEEAIISGSFSDRYLHFDGSTFYQQLQKIEEFRKPFYDERSRATSEEQKNEIQSRYYAAVIEYIKQHATEDATATMVVSVDLTQVEAAAALLAPEVRNGRMKQSIDDDIRLATSVLKARNAKKVVKNDTVSIGDKALELGLKDLAGNVLELKSLRGKYVVLDFWGSWCSWCIKGFPKLKEYYAKYRDKLEIVGIDCNDTDQKWRDAVEKHQIPWLHVRSEDGTTELRFCVKGFPYKVIISPKGEVLKAFMGEKADFYKFLDQVLNQNL